MSSSEAREHTVRWFSVRYSRPADCLSEAFIAQACDFGKRIMDEGAKTWRLQVESTPRTAHQAACTSTSIFSAPWCDCKCRRDPNDHYQGVFQLAKKERPGAIGARWGTTWKGVQVTACSANGKDALTAYCTKSASRIAGPWGDEAFAKELKRTARSDSFDPKEEVYAPDSARPFQKSLTTLALEPIPKGETPMIAAVVDPTGQSGKTLWGNWMDAYYPEQVCFLTQGDARSLAMLAMSDEHAHKRVYIINVTRSMPKDSGWTELLSFAEGLSDGRISVCKYVPKNYRQRPARVFILTNELPPMSGLSAARWAVLGITSSHELLPFDFSAHKKAAEAKAQSVADAKIIALEKKRLVASNAAVALKKWKLSADGIATAHALQNNKEALSSSMELN